MIKLQVKIKKSGKYNYIKIISFFLLSALFLLAFNLQAEDKKVFIMLDVDNTLLDKIAPVNGEANAALAKEIVSKKLAIQTLTFYCDKNSNEKFFKFYLQKVNPKFLVVQQSQDVLKITENIVIRPTIKTFLEKLQKLKFPVYILICSRSDDHRVRNLIANLNLEIYGEKFRNKVDFVLREAFRVEIKDNKNKITPGKSAYLLRKSYYGKYGTINKNDLVINIDQTSDHQFIFSNTKKDFNFKVKAFIISELNNYDIASDELRFLEIVKKIEKLYEQN